MRKFIFLTGLLVCYYTGSSQVRWEGNYKIEIVFAKHFPESKKANHWATFRVVAAKDSMGRYTWSSEVYHEKPIWNFRGYAVAKDTNELVMYAQEYTDHRPRKERQVNEDMDPSKPFYIITRKKNNTYSINRLQGKVEEITLIKVN